MTTTSSPRSVYCCLVCTTEVREGWGQVLPCGHIHCNKCLREGVKAAMRNTPFLPARCCSRIDLGVLRRVFPSTELQPYVFSHLVKKRKLSCSRASPIAIADVWASTTPRSKSTAGTPSVAPLSLQLFEVQWAAQPLAGNAIPRYLQNIYPKLCCHLHECERLTAKRQTCMGCFSRYHFGSCDDPIEIFGGRNDVAFRVLCVQMEWKPCPECRRVTSKTEGCNHIVYVPSWSWGGANNGNSLTSLEQAASAGVTGAIAVEEPPTVVTGHAPCESNAGRGATRPPGQLGEADPSRQQTNWRPW